MQPFATVRLVIYGVLLLFSLIVLGLACNLITNATGSFPGFVVAVSVLTLLALVPTLVVDLGPFFSWVAIELAVFGVLSVLWLASAALSTSPLLFTQDSGVWLSFNIASLCSAVQAFSWLTWLIIMAYIILLFVLANLAMTRGHKRVWLSQASNLSFSPTRTASGKSKIPPSNYGNAPYGVFPAGTPVAGYPPNQYGGQYSGQPVMQQQGAPYDQQQSYIPPPQQLPHPGVTQVRATTTVRVHGVTQVRDTTTVRVPGVTQVRATTTVRVVNISWPPRGQET